MESSYLLTDDELLKPNIIQQSNIIKKVESPKICSGNTFYGLDYSNTKKQINYKSNEKQNKDILESSEQIDLTNIIPNKIANTIPNTNISNESKTNSNISKPIDLSLVKPNINIIKINLDPTHKMFLLNQANNIYKYPLLPIVEEIKQIENSSGKTDIKYFRKGFWNLKFGKVYKIKFLCQICGKIPVNSKGYKINVFYKWAENLLTTLNISLHILQFALNIIGVRNEITQLSKLALGSLSSIQDDLINSKIDNTNTNSIQKLKDELENYTKISDSNKEIVNIDSDSNKEIKPIPITTDYINGIRDLFQALNDPDNFAYTGLVCATRDDFECAWMCGGTTDCSSTCYKSFLSKELDPIIKFSFY